MTDAAWQIVTGEYPPVPGGVADYVRSLARALAAAGEEVHVWTPAQVCSIEQEPGVHVHPIPGGYTPRGLAALSREFRQGPGHGRVLVQYVPQAFGMKAMNVAFCAWIAGLKDARVWVMFHEVAVPWAPWWRWKQNLTAAVTRLMARMLLSRADRVLVSIPSWESMLQPLAPRWGGAMWLPIPSNLPTTVPPDAAARARARLPLRPESVTIGHFGTYGNLVAPALMRTIDTLLRRDSRRVALLLGRGSEAVARELLRDSAMSGRIVAPGALDAADVAAHLVVCNVLVQPYPDGVSTRRTSAMAGLALGVATITNEGPATEALWRQAKAVELATSSDRLADSAEIVLRDPAYAVALGRRARTLYEEKFSIERTVHALRAAAETGAA